MSAFSGRFCWQLNMSVTTQSGTSAIRANASGDRIEVNLVVLKRQPVILHDEVRSDEQGEYFSSLPSLA